MNVLMSSILSAMLVATISVESFAMEICVVGAGLDNEDGQLTYMTGIGADGAEPKPIKPMNAKVRKTLESAAKSLDAGTSVCMNGLRNKGLFEVSSVQIKEIK